MKKYSNYFYTMMLWCVVFIVLTVLAVNTRLPEMSAILGMMSFVCLMAAMAAPDHEKYKQ